MEVVELDDLCVVYVPGLSVQESYKGFLNGRNGPALRECRNIAESIVPCNEEHTGEVVFREDPNQPQDLDCEPRADKYMNAPVERHFREVEVLSDDNQPRRCVVEVRGNNSLDTSLRNLGSNAIQLGPGT